MSEKKKNWAGIQKLLNTPTTNPADRLKEMEYEMREAFISNGFFTKVVMPFFKDGEKDGIVEKLNISNVNGDLNIYFEVPITDDEYPGMDNFQLEAYLNREKTGEDFSLIICHLNAGVKTSQTLNVLDFYNSENAVGLFSIEFYDLVENLMEKIKQS